MDEGERQAVFDSWISSHRGLLFKVVRAYAFTPHDQEDLFQEVALQVWNSVPGFRHQARVATWLYRVALYSAMSWSKSERRHSDLAQNVECLDSVLVPGSKRPDPRLEWLYEQIRRLDEVDRSLTLMMLDGLTYREMAQATGITENHVGVKINRIKKYLSERTFEGANDGL